MFQTTNQYADLSGNGLNKKLEILSVKRETDEPMDSGVVYFQTNPMTSSHVPDSGVVAGNSDGFLPFSTATKKNIKFYT